MTYTRQQLEDQIADDLSRGDLTNQISLAIDAAIRAYRFDPFAFNQAYRVTATLSVSADSISLDALAVRFRRFDRLRLRRSANDDMDLWKRDPDWIMGRQDIRITSMPLEYAVYGNAIQFDSMADQTYTLYIDGIKDLTFSATSTASDSSAWFNEARELIRHRAKRELYAHTIKDMEMASVAGEAERDAYKTIKAEMEAQNGTGFIRPTTF